MFWTLGGAVVATAIRIVRALFPWRGLADATLRCGVVAFALIVLAGFALGGTGLIGPVPYLVLGLAMFAASTMLTAQVTAQVPCTCQRRAWHVPCTARPAIDRR